jgi:hypothetical protein
VIYFNTHSSLLWNGIYSHQNVSRMKWQTPTTSTQLICEYAKLSIWLNIISYWMIELSSLQLRQYFDILPKYLDIVVQK